MTENTVCSVTKDVLHRRNLSVVSRTIGGSNTLFGVFALQELGILVLGTTFGGAKLAPTSE